MCIPITCGCEVHSFFLGVPLGPEAGRAFGKIGKWLQQVIENTKRGRLTDEFGCDDFDEIMREIIVTHLAGRGSPEDALLERMSETHTEMIIGAG
jgi:hypothetical protein